MRSLTSETSTAEYKRLTDVELESLDKKDETYRESRWWIKYVQLVACFIFALLVGTFLGRHSIKTHDNGLLCEMYPEPSRTVLYLLTLGSLAPVGGVISTWHHNTTFSQKPTVDSELAWNSIVPVGRGFIHHPDLAPFISNIAVFHQIHCLVSLSPPLSPTRCLFLPRIPS